MNTQQSLHNMKTIVCTVNKVIFHDQKTGKAILNAIKDNGKSCRLLGKIQNVAEGTILEAIGVWEQDEKYGWQFVAESIQESSQTDEMQVHADDTMMHALDFSNILNQKVKDFRVLDLGYGEEFQQSVSQADGTKKRKKKKASKLGFPTIKADDGATYNQKMTMLVSVPKRVSAFVIPDTVNCINNNAFLNCGIESISISESVKVIGDHAFAGCTKLSSITIPESVRNIGTHLFDGCSKLTSICLPQDVKGINGYVFYDCPELTLIDIPGCDVSIEYDVSSHSKYLKISKTDISKTKETVTTRLTACVTDKTVELDWIDVDFHYGYIRIPNQLGNYTITLDDNVDYTINPWRTYMSKMIPNLIVHFDHEGHPTIVNADDMHDAVISLRIKNDLSALIRSGYKTTEILRTIDKLKPKYKRVLQARDKSKYLKFLLGQHASNKYPIVPIEERFGPSKKEEGTLYTIMIDGQPNIVWENNNDSRSSFVFRCTDEDYIETRQVVFDYIVAEETGKRKLLHSDKCTSIFKEKPRTVVHNNLNSWAQRLMCDPKLIVEPTAITTNSQEQSSGEITASKGNPKYKTEIIIEDVEGELNDITFEDYDISVNASVWAEYYKVFEGKRQLLISCKFTVYTIISGEFDEDMTEWDIEDFGENDEIVDIASKLDVNDFEGLSKLDFFALGVPTSGEGLSSKEIGSLLSDALDKAGIDWSSGEYKCTELYSKEKPSGDFFN